MKICPNCKAELDDNARFCLSCMTALDEKEQIPPPVRKMRRWPVVLICILLLSALLTVIVILCNPGPEDTTVPPRSDTTSNTDAPPPSGTVTNTDAPPAGETDDPPESDTAEDPLTITHTVDGVCYTFRPATVEDHPSGFPVDNYYVLTRVEGTPTDGIYRVPTFVDGDINSLVTVVADGAFAGTNAQIIDLGHTVRYVWGNAFGGYPLTDLYLHDDVRIEQTAFSGCSENLTIHCPDYLGNTEGILWSDLAITLGFQWRSELI